MSTHAGNFKYFNVVCLSEGVLSPLKPFHYNWVPRDTCGAASFCTLDDVSYDFCYQLCRKPVCLSHFLFFHCIKSRKNYCLLSSDSSNCDILLVIHEVTGFWKLLRFPEAVGMFTLLCNASSTSLAMMKDRAVERFYWLPMEKIGKKYKQINYCVFRLTYTPMYTLLPPPFTLPLL